MPSRNRPVGLAPYDLAASSQGEAVPKAFFGLHKLIIADSFFRARVGLWITYVSAGFSAGPISSRRSSLPFRMATIVTFSS